MQALERIAKQYRDEGYEVIIQPRADQVPPFAPGFEVDLIATRRNKGVLAEIKTSRSDLARDPQITRLAEIVNAQPGWRLDVVVLEPETAIEKAAQEAAEPSDEQLAQILKAAEELADQGYSPYACVVAWGGLEVRCGESGMAPSCTDGRRRPSSSEPSTAMGSSAGSNSIGSRSRIRFAPRSCTDSSHRRLIQTWSAT
jgi:hypothetical protein